MRRRRGVKMEKLRDYSVWSLVFAVFIFGHLLCPATGTSGDSPGLVATKESRRRLVYTDAGEITTVDVNNGRKDGGSYHLEFFTLDTRSLFLPVLLHTDMVFYVHTGRGNVSWIDKERVKVVHVEEGDVYRLEEGTVFYIQSSDDQNRIKLRIHAIFSTWGDQETLTDSFTGGAYYSSIADLFRGFDNEVLQSAFGASADVVKEITRSEKVPPIIPFGIKNETEGNSMDWREGILVALSGRTTLDYVFRNKKNDEKAFSILKEKPDVENSHGWSTAVTHKEARSLKGSSMGVFMVNLTKGSMIGPHWNPRATEIAIVVKGHGMVQVVIPSGASGLGDYKSLTKRFYVKEGDVFVVPRFHPMAQMSFENSSFVFIGFNNNAKKNHPQFLAGKWSVLRTMKKEIMAASFNVKSTTLDDLLTKQNDAVLLGCDGCAEEVEKKMDVEIKKEEEEKRRKEEEEARRREERREEEEKEAKKQEEKQRRMEEEEEEAREEQRKKEEEEEARKREEEEKRRRKEEDEARRKEEDKRREEEEHRREEEEAAKKREEEKQRWKKEEEKKTREEEEKQRREKEDKEAERKEEEKQRQKEMEEEGRKREDEEEIQREEEKTCMEEEVEKKTREEEEKQRREKGDEEAERKEEEKQRHEEIEEEARKREEEEEEEEAQRRWEEEVKEEEAQRRWEEEEHRDREGEKEEKKQEMSETEVEEEETSWKEEGGRVKWRKMLVI